MPLPTLPLGTTGLEITRVGFGAWAVGGPWAFGWGEQDDGASIAAMRRAIERGLNWIDTAAVYGLGHSEEVVGKLLASLPSADRPFVFTKCGQVWREDDPMAPPVRSLRPESIRRELEGSLRRLGVERIDLYQCHWPDTIGTPLEDSWGTMLRLVEEGKVRAVGVSNFYPPFLERCEAVGHVASIQPRYSLIHPETGDAEIRWAREHGTGVIVYSPMQSGLLTDSFSAERAASLAPDDWRRKSDDFRSPALERNLALRDALRPIARRHGTTVSAVAVAWTLATPGVTGAIVGARSPEQVDGWIDAATLDPEEIEREVRTLPESPPRRG